MKFIEATSQSSYLVRTILAGKTCFHLITIKDCLYLGAGMVSPRVVRLQISRVNFF